MKKRSEFFLKSQALRYLYFSYKGLNVGKMGLFRLGK